jgi:hypothetical protein
LTFELMSRRFAASFLDATLQRALAMTFAGSTAWVPDAHHAVSQFGESRRCNSRQVFRPYQAETEVRTPVEDEQPYSVRCTMVMAGL